MLPDQTVAVGMHAGSFFGEQPTDTEMVVQGMHLHTIIRGKIPEACARVWTP
jgi:hypothetical protein